MDLATFKIRFPECVPAGDPLLAEVLSEAANALDEELFGDEYDTAHGFLTAWKLATSPRGRTAKLNISGNAIIRYQTQYEDIAFRRTSMLRLGFLVR